ncbi:MAG: hypothetical protein PHV45_04575 [Desulfuromonas thiophila]|nr:hypothetical protein [Desulfuromonas thiophila]
MRDMTRTPIRQIIPAPAGLMAQWLDPADTTPGHIGIAWATGHDGDR